MSNGKVDEQLELALQVPEDVLEKDSNLSAGYNSDNKTWELIVRYNGDISRIGNELGIIVETLSYGYAIIIIPEQLIDRLAQYDEIIYIEKPRELEFDINNSRLVSCINSIQIDNNGLFGEGVIVGIIDSGIDYSHLDFQNEDGTT